MALPIWSGVSIVAVQHLLESTGSLLHSVCALGVAPGRIHVLGKHYSSNPEVADSLRSVGVNIYDSTDTHRPGQFARSFKDDATGMWKRAAQSFAERKPALLIVLDDGGRCLRSIPPGLHDTSEIIGIEQTTSGVRPYAGRTPVIQVATSAAKKLLEPPLIAEATFLKIMPYLPMPGSRSRCGVIGLGSIGKAVANGLHSMGHEVLATDVNALKYQSVPYATWCTNAAAVLKKADYIYGCTGVDVFPELSDIQDIHGSKILFSVSSEDIEFNGLLKLISSKRTPPPRQDVEISLSHAMLRIIKGGFPVNFDGSRVSVASEAIQLTRGLLLGAILQAASLHGAPPLKSARSKLMLDPAIQRFVVDAWLSRAPTSMCAAKGMAEGFNDLSWIAANSQGQQIQIPLLRNAFQ